MFGNNKPFGAATPFGGGSFGTTTPFGQSSTAFGTKPATSNVFGTSTFGAQSNTGGLFGSTTQPTGPGIFGQPTNTFGTPASTSTGSFGFGGTSSSGGLFGNTAPTMQNSGGLFGSSTSAFGAPRPAFGGFGTTTPGTGLFGQNTNTGASLFGATSGFTGTTPTGTTIKFNPPTGTDTMMKGGVSTSIGTRHQCITCMKEYENKSLEELRVEDYAANRKGGSGGIGFGTTAQQTGLFGSTSAASTSGFSFGNTTQSKPLFGTTGTTNTFGSGNLFGQAGQAQNTGLFGKSVGFGTATTSASNVFNFGNANTMGTGTGLFGQNNQQKPLFGQTTNTSGSLFGNTATTQSTGFGTSTGFGAFGATNQQSGGLFGSKPTAFGAANTTTTNSFNFGNTNSMNAGLFGQKPGVPAFGTTTGFGQQSSGFGSFGTPANTGTGLFGQKPATSVFGATGSTFGTSLGSTFGTSTFPTMAGLGTNTGTNFFGSTANKAPGFNFPGTGSTGFNFGGTSNPSSFNFNPTSMLLGPNDPNKVAALRCSVQHILGVAENPYGDSPLFRNPLKDSSHESEVLKPTNPSAQKALLNDSQYKIASLPTAKIKPKAWTPSPSGKTYLFDGLEDEEPSLNHAAFLPKKNVKKLVLKSLGANHSTVTFMSDSAGASNQNSRIDISISLNRSDKSPSNNSANISPNIVPLTTSIPEIQNNSMDDSIAALHTNKPAISPKTLSNLCEFENNSGDKDTSVEDEWNSANTSGGDNVQTSSNKTGIILTKDGYYTSPSMDELSSLVDQNGDCFVENFTIGRKGYGKVTFFGKLNVARLNLDEIVHFDKKEINIYPDDDKKPPVGEGLNRKAVVTLEKVWPTDKTNHCPIQDLERLKMLGYTEKIEKSTNRLGAKFINYIPETGSWIFQVEHFSKYGLEDSDEEMDISKPPENKPPTQNDLSRQTLPPLNNSSQRQFLKRKPISIAQIDDDEMGDPFSIPPSKEFLFPDDDFPNEVYSPTQPQFNNHIDAEKIQRMKASFFQEMDEDNWGAGSYQCHKVFYRKDRDLNSFASTNFNEIGDNLSKKHHYLDFKVDQNYLSSVLPAKFIDTGIHNSMSSLSISQIKQNECLPFPLVRSISHDPTLIEKQVIALNNIRLKPFEKSVLWKKDNFLADAGYFMGRRFRPGWRSDGTLVTLQSTSDIDDYNKTYPKFLFYGDSTAFSSKSSRQCGFTLTLMKIDMNFTYNSEKQLKFLKNNLISALELQLEGSVSTIDDDSPLFVPKPGVELIHSHAKLFESFFCGADPTNSDIYFNKQCVLVWNLLVSLWGKINSMDEDETLSNYAIQMARREALSSWLIKASETTVMKEISCLNQDHYLTKVFLYLSCRRISDAVQLAQQHQDFRLSLLLSQAEGTNVIRKWLCSQLLNWEENGAYKFIKYDRILLYAMLAGLLIWENVYQTVNCCKNLDWKQALALHLWYHCEPNASIQVAVEEYDKAFLGQENVTKYSLPPYPSCVSIDMFDEGMPDVEVYDTCYHLLKLYCNRAYHMNQLLMPQTYTTDHLDYRLSWLLHLALSSVGFHIPGDLSLTLHINFVSQLESMDMWHWAIFVCLHHPDSKWRIKSVKDILLRYVSLDQNEDTEEKETFLKKYLHIPKEWIFEAKAIKAHSLGKHPEEAWFLLKAGFWNRSHSIVIKYLASDAVINEDYGYLMKYLSELAIPERSCLIINWSSGGQIYLDYINMCQMVQGVLSLETSAYDLEKFTPEVLSLCTRLASIPTPLLKDRLSVAEMAKKTATILRSIALLQSGRTKNKSSLLMLPTYFKNLPMPHDYAVSENRFIAHCVLKEVTLGNFVEES